MELPISIKLNDFFRLNVFENDSSRFPEDQFWILSPKGSFFRLKYSDVSLLFFVQDFSTAVFNNINYPTVRVHFTVKELVDFLKSIDNETMFLNEINKWKPIYQEQHYNTISFKNASISVSCTAL